MIPNLIKLSAILHICLKFKFNIHLENWYRSRIKGLEMSMFVKKYEGHEIALNVQFCLFKILLIGWKH